MKNATWPLVFALIMFPVPATSQDNFDDVFENEYVVQMNSLLDKWNSRDYKLLKSDVEKQFMEAVQIRAAKPIYKFEKRRDYIEIMQKRWSSLPNQLVPKKAVTLGARLVIIGSIYDRRDQLGEILPDAEEFEQEFQMAIYVTLGSSQQEAIKYNRDDIDARSVFSGFWEYWSIPYPICCWRWRR